MSFHNFETDKELRLRLIRNEGKQLPQSKQNKNRKCRKCRGTIYGTAKDVKEHCK